MKKLNIAILQTLLRVETFLKKIKNRDFTKALSEHLPPRFHGNSHDISLKTTKEVLGCSKA